MLVVSMARVFPRRCSARVARAGRERLAHGAALCKPRRRTNRHSSTLFSSSTIGRCRGPHWLNLVDHGTGEPEHRIPPGGRLDQNTHEAIPSAQLQGYLEIGRSTGDGVIRVHSMLVVKQGY